MSTIHKAVAVVVRRRWGERRELLVFDHPSAGTQIVKGTVEPGEAPADAALRELVEESGLAGVCVHESIGTWDRVSRSGPSEPGPEERHRWHLYTLIAPDAVADAWQHVAEGSPEESGLTFSFRWVPIDESLAAALHPLFGPVAHMIVDHFRSG